MGDIRLTYSQLVGKIDSVAAALLNKGLKKGDKVVLWATASPAWLYTYYGIIRSGGIALILNANLTLKDAKPPVEFADTNSRLSNVKTRIDIDFTYDKDFDITGFLMQHEPID